MIKISILLNDKTNSQEILLAGMPATDQILAPTSKNPIANKTVYNALASKIEKSVNDLVNYYIKDDVYNKTEVRQLVGSISTLTIAVVSTLPTTDISTTTIYFLGPTSGTYEEYVYVNSAWVKIGDTQIDLSNYVTTPQLNLAIADFLTETQINLLLDAKQDKMLSSSVTIGAETVGAVEDAIEEIADIVPSNVSSSNKLATIADVEDARVTIDNAISPTSENPVQNKVIKESLDAKQNLIFEGTTAEWNALPATDKAKYSLVTLTDDSDYAPNVADVVEKGNMAAVTSNAVAGVMNNHNVLHNPWFQVNQRNVSGATTNNVYIADRWKCYSYGTGFVITRTEDGYLDIDNTNGTQQINVFQKRTTKYFTSLDGELVTASIMFSDGSIQSGTTVFSSSASVTFISNTTFNLATSMTSEAVITLQVKAGKHITVKALKLELGAMSTLALDPRPEMAGELLECQRYFQRIPGDSSNPKPLWLGVARNASEVQFYISLPSGFRESTPTVTLSGVTTMNIAGTQITGTTLTVDAVMSNILVLDFTKSSAFTAGQPYLLRIDAGGYIDINAEV